MRCRAFFPSLTIAEINLSHRQKLASESEILAACENPSDRERKKDGRASNLLDHFKRESCRLSGCASLFEARTAKNHVPLGVVILLSFRGTISAAFLNSSPPSLSSSSFSSKEQRVISMTASVVYKHPIEIAAIHTH
jgi:hypothetical protein